MYVYSCQSCQSFIFGLYQYHTINILELVLQHTRLTQKIPPPGNPWSEERQRGTREEKKKKKKLLNIISRKTARNTSQLPLPPIIRTLRPLHNPNAISLGKNEISIPLSIEIIQCRDEHRRGLGLRRSRRGFLLRGSGRGSESDVGLLARRDGTSGGDWCCRRGGDGVREAMVV